MKKIRSQQHQTVTEERKRKIDTLQVNELEDDDGGKEERKKQTTRKVQKQKLNRLNINKPRNGRQRKIRHTVDTVLEMREESAIEGVDVENVYQSI